MGNPVWDGAYERSLAVNYNKVTDVVAVAI